MAYRPEPADLSGVELPAELLALTEKIAENVHEVWAAGRIAEGWTYGPVRDDAAKRTPCLVPYGELPESEKEYDRRTAMDTLRFLIAEGYVIGKKGSGRKGVTEEFRTLCERVFTGGDPDGVLQDDLLGVILRLIAADGEIGQAEADTVNEWLGLALTAAELRAIWEKSRAALGQSFEAGLAEDVARLAADDPARAADYRRLVTLACELLAAADGVLTKEEQAEAARIREAVK